MSLRPPAAVETTITYLEMTARPQRPPVPRPAIQLALLRAERPSVGFYRYLYDAVGGPWLWVDRKRMSDEELAQILGDDKVEVYILYVKGVPAGYAELDRRSPPDIELAYFGIMPEFIGQGLGAFLLDWVVRRAWEYAPNRLLVNTCTLDHPRALPLYQRFGFTPYAQSTRLIEPIG